MSKVDTFVEDCEAIMASASHFRPASNIPVQGSLWVGVASGRRGSIWWSTKTLVRIQFTETTGRGKTHRLADFLRLYKPIDCVNKTKH